MPNYQDVETMLFRGFLTTEVEVAGVPVVFKTLNHIEYGQLDLQSFSMTEEWEDSASYFLAYSTLFFNHVNVLPDREAYIPMLADYYRQFPKSVLVAFLKVTARLNKKAGEALQKVQGYSCGPQSRQMWLMYRGIPLCDPQVTGFAGTDRLGINMHQRMWSYFNVTEDEEVDYLQQYGLAKFVVSPHAPKDVKRMDAKDSKKIRERDQRRKSLYHGKDYVNQEQEQILITKDSAEELMAQMRNELEGEQDYHDLIIAQHKEQVRTAYLRQKAEQERRRQEAYERRLRAEVEEVADALSGEGYSAEEIAHYLEKSDHLRRVRRSERSDNYKPLEEKEEKLIRWGFLDHEDIPEERRHFYKSEKQKEENFENPLIKEHYERVSDDLKSRQQFPLDERDKES